MKVCSANNNVYFTARSPKIVEAEKFCRLVGAEFPAVSSTKYTEFKFAKAEDRFQHVIDNITEKDKKCIRDPLDKARSKSGYKEAIMTLIEAVKEHKIANCADFAKLCSAICHMNGVEVIQPELHLVTKDGRLTNKIVDHAVLMIKPAKMKFIEKMSKLKDVIIIDPWLNFADFAPNVERRFKGEYSKFFGISEDMDIALSPYTPQGMRFDADTINTLREKYPQLIIQKDRPLIGGKNGQ